MSEHGPDSLAPPATGSPADEALAIGLARAVVGAHACKRAALTPVDDTDPRPSGSGPHLSLTPYWPLGYPMIAEMLVLDRLENPDWTGETSGDGDGDAADDGDDGAGWAARALSDTAAFFFDELVNPVLPYGARAPAAAQKPPLNRPYQRAATEAVFAKSPEAPGIRAQRDAARDLLYDTDETGELVASQVQLTYWDFVAREESARAALEALPPDASEADRTASEAALDRVRADWQVIGRRTEVEAAMRLLAAPDSASRNKQLLDRLRASLQLRPDLPGASYAVSRLVPVTPLLTGTGDGDRPGGHGWERVELGREAARAAVLEFARTALVPSVSELEPAIAGLERVSFEFLACDVQREWLSEELFTAHDWDLPDSRRLADGLGGGPLGGYASALLFVRGMSLRYAGAPAARFGPQLDAEPEEVRVIAASEEVAGQEQEKVATALAAAQHIGLAKAATLLRRQRDSTARTTVRRIHQDAVTLNRLVTAPLVTIVGADDGTAEPVGRPPRPGLIGAIAGIASMAHPQDRLSRVRDRIRRVRSRERADDDPGTRRRVRHRGRRVRDHRRPRVRDHRDRDRRTGRVPSERSPGSRRPTVLRFSVAVTAERPDLLDGLTLHGQSAAGQEMDFPLRRESTAGTPSLACESQVALDRGRDGSREWTFTLAAAGGQALDTQLVTASADEDDTVDLSWRITTTPVVIELTSPVTPTLYGYALTLVPACPNPDPSLDWSGTVLATGAPA